MNKKSLRISGLSVSLGDKNIISDLNIEIGPGAVHVIMGPNGSGKSTFAQALLGNPQYQITFSAKSKGHHGGILLGSSHINLLSTEERAKKGIFLAFQNPISIPGVTVMNILRSAYEETFGKKETSKDNKKIENPVLQRRSSVAGLSISDFIKLVDTNAAFLHIEKSLLSRGINDGFSGGERKKIEMLQAIILKPKFAVFDEIDTGLDVDALRVVSEGIMILKKSGTGVIIITHYQRILKFIKPDMVHILVKGKLVKSGGFEIVRSIEKSGYSKYLIDSPNLK